MIDNNHARYGDIRVTKIEMSPLKYRVANSAPHETSNTSQFSSTTAANNSSLNNTNIRTVKLNLKTIIDVQSSDNEHVQVSVEEPSHNLTSQSIPATFSSNKYTTLNNENSIRTSPLKRQINFADFSKQDIPQMKRMDSDRSEREEVVRKVLNHSDDNNNAFLESLMRRHENSVRCVVAEAHDSRRMVERLRDQQFQSLNEQNSYLKEENERLLNKNSLLTKELTEIRSDLLKSQSECKRLDQTVVDLEALFNQQEETHEIEIRRLSHELELERSKTEAILKSSKINENQRKVDGNRGEDVLKPTLSSINPKAQHLLEAKYSQALQAQTETQEKLLKRERQLLELNDRYKLLQQEMNRRQNMSTVKQTVLSKTFKQRNL